MKQKVLVIFEYEEAHGELQSVLGSATIATVFAATPDDASAGHFLHEISITQI